MNMPRMNGLEALEHLKTDALYKHIPVVMLSTASDTNLIRSAYNCGVNAFIEKPIFELDFVRLAEAIDVCFLNASHQAGPQQRKHKYNGSIIIVEDNEEQLFFMRRALENGMPHVRVYEYTDGRELVADLKDRWSAISPGPQLILMDLYMPTRQAGLDLLLAIHKILTSKSNHSIPVIVFTSSNDPEDRKVSYQHNANAFMIKDSDMLQWHNDFKNLHRFWRDTVTR